MLVETTKKTYRCDVCGYETDSEYAYNHPNDPCNAAKELEQADVREGDEVWVYAPDPWRPWKPLRGEHETINKLHYSQPHERIFWHRGFAGKEIPAHALVVELAQGGDIDSDGNVHWRAYRSDDSLMSWRDMTFQDFLLWREGNREKLEAAGLLMRKPGWLGRFWWRLTNRC